MTGVILILCGLVLIAATSVAGYLFLAARCGLPDAPACNADFSALISYLMIANEGLLFWLAWVFAVFMIWGGVRLRASGR